MASTILNIPGKFEKGRLSPAFLYLILKERFAVETSCTAWPAEMLMLIAAGAEQFHFEIVPGFTEKKASYTLQRYENLTAGDRRWLITYGTTSIRISII
jgi:hypothetical protein